MKKLGNLIKLRKIDNLNQQQLAAKIRVTRNVISDWEIGRSSPNVGYLNQLADYFGVSVDYILGREEHEYQKQKQPHIVQQSGVEQLYNKLPQDLQTQAYAYMEFLLEKENEKQRREGK